MQGHYYSKEFLIYSKCKHVSQPNSHHLPQKKKKEKKQLNLAILLYLCLEKYNFKACCQVC